jgi:hypothetical protein
VDLSLAEANGCLLGSRTEAGGENVGADSEADRSESRVGGLKTQADSATLLNAAMPSPQFNGVLFSDASLFNPIRT